VLCHCRNPLTRTLSIAVDFRIAFRLLLSSSICRNVESLTLTYTPDDLEEGKMVPRMRSLSHLKVMAAWPSFNFIRPIHPRLSLARFPKLTWLKLCGYAPPQFLKLFAGQTTSIQRCVIRGSLNFKDEGTNFFGRFSGGLSVLVVAGGIFSQPVTCKFPKLRSLKLVGGYGIPPLETLDCPHLERLSVSESGSCALIGGSFVKTLVAQCSSTLTTLHLDASSRAAPLTFPKSFIDVLSWCEELQVLGIHGPLRLTQESLRVFGRTHVKLKAVMVSYDGSGLTPNTVLDDMQVGFRLLVATSFVLMLTSDTERSLHPADPRSAIC
jgi:hypothetical protein